jgi:hypothetical protein
MRINTKGHMVFGSEFEAVIYARGAGFTVTGSHLAVASRSDMTSSFQLQRMSKGFKGVEYMWYRNTSQYQDANT